MLANRKIWYDGGCFFCKNFVLLTKLRNKTGVQFFPLSLRDHPHDVARFRELGYDPNEGMIVETKHRIPQGERALRYLLNSCDLRISLSYRCVVWLYPIMRFGRNVFNAIRGINCI